MILSIVNHKSAFPVSWSSARAKNTEISKVKAFPILNIDKMETYNNTIIICNMLDMTGQPYLYKNYTSVLGGQTSEKVKCIMKP